jgi:hypothetical protein
MFYVFKYFPSFLSKLFPPSQNHTLVHHKFNGCLLAGVGSPPVAILGHLCSQCRQLDTYSLPLNLVLLLGSSATPEGLLLLVPVLASQIRLCDILLPCQFNILTVLPS